MGILINGAEIMGIWEKIKLNLCLISHKNKLQIVQESKCLKKKNEITEVPEENMDEFL